MSPPENETRNERDRFINHDETFEGATNRRRVGRSLETTNDWRGRGRNLLEIAALSIIFATTTTGETSNRYDDGRFFNHNVFILVLLGSVQLDLFLFGDDDDETEKCTRTQQ